MEDQTVRNMEKRKKRFLKRYRKNVDCIERLERKKVDLESRIGSVKLPSLSGMPRGGTPVTQADLVSEKIDLEKRIEKLKEKNHKVKEEILEEIDALEDTRYCEVMEAHFIDGLTFERIAEYMGYTERHIYNLYKEAISLLVVMDIS